MMTLLRSVEDKYPRLLAVITLTDVRWGETKSSKTNSNINLNPFPQAGCLMVSEISSQVKPDRTPRVIHTSYSRQLSRLHGNLRVMHSKVGERACDLPGLLDDLKPSHLHP